MNKKIVLAVLLLIIGSAVRPVNTYAYDFWKHKKSMQIGYVNHTLIPEYGGNMESQYGISYSSMHSIWLHKEPIAGCLKFAIDWGENVNYIQYKMDGEDAAKNYHGTDGYTGTTTSDSEDEVPDLGLRHIDLGLRVGPSITVNPVDEMRIVAYCYVVPSYSMYINHTEVNAGFVPQGAFGCEVSWKWIGLGVEKYFGQGKYTDLVQKFSDNKGEILKSNYFTEAVRFYLSFRF